MPNKMGNTSGQEIIKITTVNNKTNGKSTNANTVAELINPRIDSKDCKLDAKDPTEIGRSDNFIPNTRSIMTAESVISVRLAARSTNQARIMRKPKSAVIIKTIPSAKTHNVSVA